MTGVAKSGRRGAGVRRRAPVSTRTRDAISFLIERPEAGVEEAAAHVGLTVGSLRRQLQTPGARGHYLKFIRSLLDGTAVRAARWLDHVIQNGQSEYTRNEAARYVLDRVAPRPEQHAPAGDGTGVRITFISYQQPAASAPGTVIVDGVPLEGSPSPKTDMPPGDVSAIFNRKFGE